jgi:hypothetical protein
MADQESPSFDELEVDPWSLTLPRRSRFRRTYECHTSYGGQE